MTGIAAQQAICAETTCRAASSELHRATSAKLEVEMTSNTLSRRYDLMVHQAVYTNVFRELLNAPHIMTTKIMLAATVDIDLFVLS
jgi:hypothetical protein